MQWINPKYTTTSTIKQLQKKFKTNKPFPYLELCHFFNTGKAIALLKAVTKEKFYEKEADLFKFMQTNDLLQTNNKIIKEFIHFLTSKPFISYIQKITNLKLKNKILLLMSSKDILVYTHQKSLL